MPKKKNFLGGMQNYNPNNGQYESALTTASGEVATPSNVPGGKETPKKPTEKSAKKDTTFEEINNKRMGIAPKSKVETDEYGLFGKDAVKTKGAFLKEKGIEDVFELSNEDFTKLAKEVQERFGIEDFKLAEEFLVSGDVEPKGFTPKEKPSKNAITEQQIGDTIRKNKIDMDYGKLDELTEIIMSSNNPKLELQNAINTLKGASGKSIQKWIESKKFDAINQKRMGK